MIMIIQGLLILFATLVMLVSMIGAVALLVTGTRDGLTVTTFFTTLIILLVMFKILFTGEFIL